MTDSHVPQLCPDDCHAISMPDTARSASRLPSDLSQSVVDTLVLISVSIIDTSSMVHFRSSQSPIPDEILFRLLTLALTTGALYARSPGRFGTTAWSAIPRDLPSSQLQHGKEPLWFIAFMAHRQLPWHPPDCSMQRMAYIGAPDPNTFPLWGRSPRIRAWTFTMQPQHLPYPLNPGLCHVVLTYPETRPRMLFLFVGSSLCAPASSGRFLAVPPLPSASTCANVKFTLAGFTYRGLAPHKFTPMPDVHKALHRTPIPQCSIAAAAGELGRSAPIIW